MKDYPELSEIINFVNGFDQDEHPLSRFVKESDPWFNQPKLTVIMHRGRIGENKGKSE